MITVALAVLFLLGCTAACVYFDRMFGDSEETGRRHPLEALAQALRTIGRYQLRFIFLEEFLKSRFGS
jgi:hypothetical protein